MTKLIKILIIVNTIFMIYLGQKILFMPQYYSQPMFIGNGTDRLVVWKQVKVNAPIPKFVNKFKERLWDK